MKDIRERIDKKQYWRRVVLMVLGIYAIILLEILLFLNGNHVDRSAAQNEESKRIGVVYMTMNNPFYSVIDNQLQLRVDSEGDQLLSRDSAMDQKQQNTQIENLLDSQIDLLIVNPVDSEGVMSAIEKAAAKNVPVVVVDAPLKDSDLPRCSIYSDNYGAGVQCAEDLMNRLDCATIFILEHSSVESASERIRGFEETLKDHPEYRIIGREETKGQLEVAMPATEKLIDEHGTPDVIMALNDPSALGAMEALEKNGLLGKVLVYGVDGTPEAKALIQNGTMTGTSAQQVYQMGETLGNVVYNILQGEKPNKEIVIPVQMITEDNVNQYNIDGWQ